MILWSPRSVVLVLPVLCAAGACTPSGSAPRPGDGEARAPAASATPAVTAEPAAPAAAETAAAEAAAPEPGSGDAAGASAKTVPDIEYVPTPNNVVEKMLDVAKIGKDDILYDLGCGDGRIVVAAAKKHGLKARGFDIDPVRVAESRENVKKAKVEHLVTIEQRDIFEVDLSPATVVTLYLLPELNVRLVPQLEKLKPGSRVVSHDFDMAGVEPEKWWTVMAPDHRDAKKTREHYVYLWKTPLKKTGAKK